MHCSDENLVAYLDGELPWWKRKVTAGHLHSCWQCRTRLAAAEQQIQRLTQEMEEWSFPGSEWKSESRLRLNARMREFESRAAAAQKISARPREPHRWLWQAAACAALAVAFFALWPRERFKESPLTPTAAITRASAAEGDAYAKPLQQSFAVEIAELRPVRRTRSTRLEVWADRGTGRFASQWTGEDGTLRHAVWRPGQGQSDVLYNPAVSGAPVPWSSPSDQPLPLSSLVDYGLDVAQIESAFLKWLESGVGRAVSFTPDLAVWSHQDGTMLNAELVRAENEGESAVIRVTAQRTTNRVTAILRVEYDSDSYLPRLQALRFETPERAVEFRLTATRIRVVSGFKGDLFAPAKELFPERALRSVPALSQEPAGLPDIPAALSEGSFEDYSEGLEAHYVLHQTGACMGQPVRIEEQKDGVRIQSLSQGPWRESFTSRARLGAVLSAFADLRDVPPPTFDLPDGADAGFEAAAALRHAWALTRLATHFPTRTTGKMNPENWRLLEIMVREHVTFIATELQPFHFAEGVDRAMPPGERNWRDSTSVVLETLTRALALLHDEPMAKLVPLLQEVDAELHVMSDAFSSEHQRSRAVVASHGR